MSARAIFLLFGIVMVSRPELRSVFAQQQPDVSLLPFVTSDAVIQRDPLSRQTIRLTGMIEDLAGDAVQIRRAGGTRVERYRLREVVEVQFLKSPAFDKGLVHLQRQEWLQAIPDLEAALGTEQRIWVQREIQAAAAEAALALGRSAEVVARIQKISESDPMTRHVGLLPLVWGSSPSEDVDFAAEQEGLTEGTLLMQLVTASALLHRPEFEAEATATLVRLRVDSRPQLQELAEAQLWRLRLLHPEQLKKIDTELWSDRVQEMGRDIRCGPEFVLGTALMLQFDYDQAAEHLMWPALMRCPHRELVRASLTAAAEALTRSGRPVEAALARQQLAIRFPDASAAPSP